MISSLIKHVFHHRWFVLGFALVVMGLPKMQKSDKLPPVRYNFARHTLKFWLPGTGTLANLQIIMQKIACLTVCISFLFVSFSQAADSEPQRQYPSALDMPQEKKEQEQAEKQVDAFERFSLEFYRRLIDDKTKRNENVVCSPWSAAVALTMLYEGANAETAEEIQKTLRFQGDSEAFEEFLFMVENSAGQKAWETPLIIETANAFVMKADYPFHESYKQLLRDRFLAELFTVDFKGHSTEAVKAINQWCSEHTHGEIKELLTEVPADAIASIMNAIYFKAQWRTVFETKNTKPERFRLADGSISNTSMMNLKKTYFDYYETKGFKALSMPYDGNAHMLILLPDETDGLANLEKSLTSEMLRKIDETINYELVNVKLPRFEFEHKEDLTLPLRKMGIESVFVGEKADLSKLTDRKDVFIGAAIQKAIVRVDETGTVAAAITGMELIAIGEGPSVRPKVYTFYADHPFLFLIRENTDNSILFIGRVHQPEQAKGRVAGPIIERLRSRVEERRAR